MALHSLTPGFDRRIRTAGFGDLEAALEMWGAMMEEHQRQDGRIRLAPGALSAYRKYLGYHINNNASRVMIAECDDKPAGFCLLTVSHNLPMFLPERYGYLSDLYVAPEVRRRGIGRRMVELGAAWLKERDVHSIQLQYYEFNAGGGDFWRALGFDSYYTRMWLDCR